MPKITAASVTLTALVLLGLTGCAGTTETAPSEPPAPSESATVETTEAEPTPEPTTDLENVEASPVVIEPTEVEDPTAGMTPEQTYLYYVLPDLAAWGTVLTEEEALSAGKYACELIAQGETKFSVEPLVGGTVAANGSVASYATKYLCP